MSELLVSWCFEPLRRGKQVCCSLIRLRLWATGVGQRHMGLQVLVTDHMGLPVLFFGHQNVRLHVVDIDRIKTWGYRC